MSDEHNSKEVTNSDILRDLRIKDVLWAVGFIFVAGGGWYQVKANGEDIDDNTTEIAAVEARSKERADRDEAELKALKESVHEIENSVGRIATTQGHFSDVMEDMKEGQKNIEAGQREINKKLDALLLGP
jgi:septal ring factor EnvC (AmiA/AmiB activator)